MIATSFIGQRSRAFIQSSLVVFVLSALFYILGNWDQASKYNLETPPAVLVLGLIIPNVNGLPRSNGAATNNAVLNACTLQTTRR